MVIEAKGDEELEILLKEYGSDINDIIEREKEKILSGTSNSSKSAWLESTNKRKRQSVSISPSITTIENANKLPKRPPQKSPSNSNKYIKDNSKSNDADQESNSSDTSNSDDTAYEPEEYEFTCGIRLLNKFMKLTKSNNVGLNILPEFDLSSQASLSHNITEQAKISYSDLAINDIHAWKNSCTVNTFNKEIKGHFMKSVRNIRTGVIVIDPLKTKPEVLAIKKQAEDRLLQYQIVCQKDLTKYVGIELKYYKEHRYTIFKITLEKIAYAAAKEHRTLKLNQAKIKDF